MLTTFDHSAENSIKCQFANWRLNQLPDTRQRFVADSNWLGDFWLSVVFKEQVCIKIAASYHLSERIVKRSNGPFNQKEPFCSFAQQQLPAKDRWPSWQNEVLFLRNELDIPGILIPNLNGRPFSLPKLVRRLSTESRESVPIDSRSLSPARMAWFSEEP